MEAEYSSAVADSLETLASRKGLDYVISRGVQAIEAEKNQRIGSLINTIKLMGDAVERGDFDVAQQVYNEFRAG